MESQKNIISGSIDTGGGDSINGDNNTIIKIFDGLSFLLAEYKEQLNEINGLILSFKPKTALNLLVRLESRINESNTENDNKIKSRILFLKSLCKKELPEFTKEESANGFIKAYSLNKEDETIRNRACVEYINIGDSPKAFDLANIILNIDEYNVTAWYVKTVISDNIKDFIKTVPKIILNDYNYQHSVIYQIINKEKLNYLEDLKDYGLQLIFDYDKYKVVDYKNKEAWVVVIDLLINKIFNDFPIRYISGDNFIIQDAPEITSAIKLINIYVDALENTEISETTKHQKFYLNYLNYISKNEDEDFKSLDTIYNQLEKPHWFYTNSICQILNHKKDFQKSLEYLVEYEELKGELNSEFYLFKSVVLHLLLKNDEIDILYQNYLNSIEILDERHLFNIINAFFNIQQHIGGKNEYKKQLEKVLEKSFSLNELKLLLKVTIELRYIKEYDVNQTLSTLNSIKDNTFLDINSKNLIADNLALIGKTNDALKFMDTYIDKSTISESLRLYIILIHKQLHNKNEDERGRYKELLNLLKFWRLNSSYIDEQLLGFEHNLYTEINDLNNLEKIDQFLYDKFPADEQYLFFYLATLERKKDTAKIKEVSTNIPTVFIDETIGVNIGGILLRNQNNTKKGFEILYNLALNPNNINARKNYFGGSMLFNEFLVKYEEVKLGNWVVYNVNGRIEKKQVLKLEGIQKDFLGKKVGDKFNHKSKLTNKTNIIEIVEIFNDALNLFREISEEARNPVNELGFESFQVPSDIKDFEKFLIEQFGANGTEEKIRTDNLLTDYYNYRIGFTEVITSVFKNHFVDGYLHLTSYVGNKFTTIPNGITQKINTENTSQKFILDFSTLLLFYFLERELKFEFKHKFIVSFYTKAEIENDLSEIVNSPESSLSVNISLEGVKKYISPEDYKNKRIEFLQSIINWIDQNCEIDLVEEKLDVTMKLPKKGEKFQSNFMKIMIDSMHFSIRENHRLISSDSSILLFNYKSNINNNILNPEKYLLTFHSEKCNSDFYRFLLKSNYLGININLETLKNEFFDFISGRENYYLLVLENLQFSVNNNPNIIIPSVQFLKYLYLSNSMSITDKNRYASEIFRNTFYGMPLELINQYQSNLISQFKLLGDYYEEVLKEFMSVKRFYIGG